MATETITTPIQELLRIKHPVLLAGMNNVAGPELAAAVTIAGGLGVIGGVGYTPKFLRNAVSELKEFLKAGGAPPDAPFGIDLLLPQVGGNARKTNYDYTDGKLPELIDIVVESGATLFVSAVGVPPVWAVEKLHAAGIPVMNMIGSTRHVSKALDAGVDIICAQGGEGGGHTGDTATTVLIPQVVDMVKDAVSPINGKPVQVIAAGGIFDGRGLAMALSLGASAVWVGTRFVASEEASCAPRHSKAVCDASSESTIRTLIYTGRPLRVLKTDYILDWEQNRKDEIKELTGKGVLPAQHDLASKQDTDEEIDMVEFLPLLMGQAAGATHEILPAKQIVEEMVADAIAVLRTHHSAIAKL